METKHRKTLAVAIVVAAVIIATAMLYLGRQLAAQPDEARVVALIEERLGGQGGGALSEQEFNARVEQGIQAFMEKQRRAQEQQPQELAKNVPPPSKDDHVYGDPEAPVTLIEYSDFECPFCRRFHATAKQLVTSSNGQVNWVYRHYPLPSHKGAQKKAEAAECAAELGGDDAFWRYADALFERAGSDGGLPVENLVPLAAKLGLDQAEFRQCLESGRFAQKVRQQMAEGERAGVTGTPGNILYHRDTGRVVAVHGAQPLERVRQAVQALIPQTD